MKTQKTQQKIDHDIAELVRNKLKLETSVILEYCTISSEEISAIIEKHASDEKFRNYPPVANVDQGSTGRN